MQLPFNSRTSHVFSKGVDVIKSPKVMFLPIESMEARIPPGFVTATAAYDQKVWFSAWSTYCKRLRERNYRDSIFYNDRGILFTYRIHHSINDQITKIALARATSVIEENLGGSNYGWCFSVDACFPGFQSFDHLRIWIKIQFFNHLRE